MTIKNKRDKEMNDIVRWLFCANKSLVPVCSTALTTAISNRLLEGPYSSKNFMLHIKDGK